MEYTYEFFEKSAQYVREKLDFQPEIGIILGSSLGPFAAQVESPEQAPAAAPAADTENRKTLVLITTDTLGRGDDELGARLMENFLASLPELGPSLWRIVLLNGGVKLAATEGKCLDTLKQLESSGVSILVCGTCLNFFYLLEAKQVGETTNMMDVVTSLSLAGKVIRP